MTHNRTVRGRCSRSGPEIWEGDIMTYVGVEKFYRWYADTAKEPRMSSEELLSEVLRLAAEEKAEEYVLPADGTRSGREERYAFRCENVGACGANTGFMYF